MNRLNISKKESKAVPMPCGAIYCAPSGMIPGNIGYKHIDARHDPLVGVILAAVHRLQARAGELSGTSGVIAVTEAGCTSHVQRVVQAVADGLRPRQAFFARASATMLATYPALALSLHGPTFSLSGRASAVRWGLSLASWLVHSSRCDDVILLAADAIDAPPRFQAAVMRVGPATPHHAGTWGDGMHLDDCLPSTVLAAWLGENISAVEAHNFVGRGA